MHQRTAALQTTSVRTGIPRLSFSHRSSKEGPEVLERRNKMNVMKSYNNWRAYRNSVTELSSLSNRSLADLGIARNDIRALARKA
jgi:uncharacterized protein YjiS (DUF1127 family)